jgi:hypothetical protein
MHKCRLVICSLFIAAGVSFPASADTITHYTVDFTLSSPVLINGIPTGGPAPTSGSFDYDSTSPRFTNFLVNWYGMVFDLTAAANAPVFGTSACTGTAATPAYGFLLLSESLSGCPSAPAYTWLGSTYGAIRFVPAVSYFQFQAISPASASPVPPVSTDFDDVITTNLLGSPLPSGGVDRALGEWTITPTSVVATPEPTSMMLLVTGLLGMMGLALLRERRRFSNVR